ncbi:MAG: hypothetical protein M1839_005646 [Geoglossum umbratile]|nr:MAG: hypothetical protein M1839_005646 [Geoglossum umbratile]
MSTFNSYRTPNVSQHIAILNTLPSAQQLASQQREAFGLEDDLVLFTNTRFFDFDIEENHTPVAYGLEHEVKRRRENATTHKYSVKSFGTLNHLQGDYQFSEFSRLPNILGDGRAGVVSILDQNPQSLSSPISASLPVSPNSNDKQQANSVSSSSQVDALEGALRIASEEDKRRRNTAASARFRVKKKQREQALERTAREMTDKCSRLKARIRQLEMENKWLKNLITEKNENQDDISELWRKFNKDSNFGRRASDRLDGVGTTTSNVG